MDCRKVDKYLYDYCDNILNPKQKAQIEKHLIECPLCSKIVRESLLESSILHEQWEIPELPDDFTARVMNRIASADMQPNPGTVYPRSPNRNRWSRRLIGLAAMAAVLLLVLYVPAMIKNNDSMQIAERKQAPSQATHETITNNAYPQKAARELMLYDKESKNDKHELPHIAGKLDNEKKMPQMPAEAPRFGELTEEAVNDASLKNAPEKFLSSPAAGKISSNKGIRSVAISNSKESQTRAIPVQPVNLPASYVLLNRADAAGASTYTFGSGDNKEPLIINIAQLSPRPSPASTYSRGYIRSEISPATDDKSGLESEEKAALPVEGQPKEQTKAPSDADALATTNTVVYELEFNHQKFLLTLSAQLPLEELIPIAANLQLSPTP